jgi:hypothetical protein
LGIQVRLAFRIGTAGFAIGAGCVAGRTFATGRLATLGARLTLGTRTFTGSIGARGIVTTRAVTGSLTIGAALTVAGTIRIGWPLSITGRTAFGAALTVARRAGRRIESLAGAIAFAAGFAISRAVGVAGTFSVAGSARRRCEPITWGVTRRAETAFAVTGRARAVAFAARAAGRRQQLVHGQLAVAIFVERAQRFRRAGDFILGDDAVAVLVERSDERRRRRPFTATGFAGRDWRTLPVFTGGCGRAALRRFCIRKARRQGERECDDGCSVFHGLGFVFVLVVVCFFRLPGSRGLKNPRGCGEFR